MLVVMGAWFWKKLNEGEWMRQRCASLEPGNKLIANSMGNCRRRIAQLKTPSSYLSLSCDWAQRDRLYYQNHHRKIN